MHLKFRIQLTKKWAFGVMKKKKEKGDQNTKVELEKKALLKRTIE